MEQPPCNVCEGRVADPCWLWVRKDEYAEGLGYRGRRSRWVCCRGCGLVFQSPRPDQAEAERLYAGNVYRAQIDDVELEEDFIEYALERPQHALQWLAGHPEFAQRFDDPRGRKAIDIGSGIGAALHHLKSRGWDVLGVEPDPRYARVAQERFGVPTRTEFLTQDTSPEGGFSFAFSQHAFEHMREPLAVARAARKLLDREKGLLFVCVPTYRRTGTYTWPYFNLSHNYMFTAATLGNLLARAGFTVLETRYFAQWGREGEIWALARADAEPVGPDPARLPFRERVPLAQAELALAPLTAIAAAPYRLGRGALRFAAHPRRFLAGSRRLRLLVQDPARFMRKARKRVSTAWTVVRLQFVRDRDGRNSTGPSA